MAHDSEGGGIQQSCLVALGKDLLVPLLMAANRQTDVFRRERTLQATLLWKQQAFMTTNPFPWDQDESSQEKAFIPSDSLIASYISQLPTSLQWKPNFSKSFGGDKQHTVPWYLGSGSALLGCLSHSVSWDSLCPGVLCDDNWCVTRFFFFCPEHCNLYCWVRKQKSMKTKEKYHKKCAENSPWLTWGSENFNILSSWLTSSCLREPGLKLVLAKSVNIFAASWLRWSALFIVHKRVE